MPDVADDAEQWVRTWSASVSEQAALTQSLSDQVSRLAVTATDPESLVTVTVDGSGGLTDLRLERQAARLEMTRLAEVIMRTMREAQVALTRQVAEIAGQTVGVDSATGRAVVSSFERRFPVDPDEDDHGN
ncbi:YbaB/EbfC family nucleoid-associated protein [Actinoplanes sp. M2I2]|uniref:YbaB/EbfC family nucleoid-associated protein n=1 Tax=Actinoplanes sp. M2I2 TaxID=1734444 RepID=UPI002021D246|nr:YbaB/EbfC family nucleoid-associated protein [Actinoplanes sp. M2I2]